MKILKHEFHASLKISASNSSLYQNILQVGRTFFKLCRTVVPLVLETLRCRTETRRRRQMRNDSNKLLHKFKSLSFVIDYVE